MEHRLRTWCFSAKLLSHGGCWFQQSTNPPRCGAQIYTSHRHIVLWFSPWHDWCLFSAVKWLSTVDKTLLGKDGIYSNFSRSAFGQSSCRVDVAFWKALWQGPQRSQAWLSNLQLIRFLPDSGRMLTKSWVQYCGFVSGSVKGPKPVWPPSLPPCLSMLGSLDLPWIIKRFYSLHASLFSYFTGWKSKSSPTKDLLD